MCATTGAPHHIAKERKIMAVRQAKKWVFGLTAAVAILGSSALRAETITVAVAANFEFPLKDIIAAYHNDFPGDNTINYVAGSTSTLEAAIIAGGLTGPYDLFLAANQAAPLDLATNHASLVAGAVFNYTRGFVTLWSNTENVNISAGLPADFFPPYGAVAIADPTKAPYGAAAWATLQAAPYSIPSLPDYRVTTYSNIDTTYLAVAAGTNTVGFVAKSQVCKLVDGTEVFTGSSHYVYAKSPIVQAGVKLKHQGRTKAQGALLASFITYLHNKKGPAAAIIASYCYKKTN